MSTFVLKKMLGNRINYLITFEPATQFGLQYSDYDKYRVPDLISICPVKCFFKDNLIMVVKTT